MSDARMVKLAELWERTSAKGSRYFSGFMGDTQVLLFDGGEKPHPTKPGETVHVWRLMVQERDPARRPQARVHREREVKVRSRAEAVEERSSGPAAKPAARPQERRDGWRGPSAYRRQSGVQRGPEPAGAALADDDLADIGRSGP